MKGRKLKFKTVFFLLAFVFLLDFCAVPTTDNPVQQSGPLKISSVNPPVIDDDYHGVLTFKGSGFLSVTGLRLQFGGIQGSHIDPVSIHVVDDDTLEVTFVLSNGVTNTVSTNWDAVITVSNVNNTLFTNVVETRECYAKMSTDPSEEIGMWAVTLVFTDNSGTNILFTFTTNYTDETIDLIRGDFLKVVSLSNTITNFSSLHQLFLSL